ncbi:AAEL017020-PA [Aedes aegypti]|uniref:AAEL017020-PA n=1 Tax=Aedes aegypti TaxID=7159 RepID=J9HTJ3_AEDAE|nr:AAEL017020-PA [Aedes aegypti]
MIRSQLVIITNRVQIFGPFIFTFVKQLLPRSIDRIRTDSTKYR